MKAALLAGQLGLDDEQPRRERIGHQDHGAEGWHEAGKRLQLHAAIGDHDDRQQGDRRGDGGSGGAVAAHGTVRGDGPMLKHDCATSG